MSTPPSFLADSLSFDEFRTAYDPSWATLVEQPDGSTALEGATHNPDADARYRITAFLLDEGADPSAHSDSSSPQHGLCGSRNLIGAQAAPLLARLFDGGADVNLAIPKFGRLLMMMVDAQNGIPPRQLPPMFDVIFAQPELDLVARSKKTGKSFATSVLELARGPQAPVLDEMADDLESRMRAFLAARGLDAEEVLS